jgi:sec-independent protein translocase protein TatC
MIVAAVVIAAVLTPPDVVSQLMLAIPLVLLYELSLAAMWFTDRRAAKQAAQSEKGQSEKGQAEEHPAE